MELSFQLYKARYQNRMDDAFTSEDEAEGLGTISTVEKYHFHLTYTWKGLETTLEFVNVHVSAANGCNVDHSSVMLKFWSCTELFLLFHRKLGVFSGLA